MCIVCVTFVLSRCFILRQLLVKMFHLLARKVVFVCVYIFQQFLVKMFHVLAVSCQDIHFSVRKVVFYSLYMCIVFHAVKMFSRSVGTRFSPRVR